MENKIYEPSEDSYFLADCLEEIVKNRKFEKVLEIGTGSGFIAFKIADKVREILAVDINPRAIKIAERERKILGVENVEFRKSDLFEDVEGKFDLIFFNPPYLPGREDIRWGGGRKGQEVTEKFLEEVKNYLNRNGIAVILLSSFNDVERLRKKYNLKLIAEKKLWFERLYCEALSKD